MVGEQKPDEDAINGFAWKVSASEHSAGYAQRDLIVNYQQDDHWGEITNSIDYTAKFRLKVDYNRDPIPVATLYAVRKEGTNEEVLAQQTIFADDFEYSMQYQYFDLPFTLYKSSQNSGEEETPLKITTSKSGSRVMDYRVYWHGYVSLWIDHVEIYDYISEPLLSGNHDSDIQSDLNSLSSYSAPYRLCIRDEPCEDNYPVATYIRSFIENSGYKGLTDALPEYAEGENTHEAPDYETYLDEYHYILQPEEYLFNHLTYQYQWWRTPRLDGLFDNLKIIREKSLQNNKDFYSTILTFGWNDFEIQEKINSGYIDPAPYSVIYDETERRMNASVFENLAYGAKGFYYWNIYPGLYRSRSGIDRTAAWYFAKEINDKVHALSDHLLNINSITTFATSFDVIPSNSFIKSVSEDSIVVGVFEHKSTGQIYFMLVNPRWYAGGEKTFTIQLDCQGYSTDVCVEDILSSTPPWNNDPNHPSTRILILNENNQYIMTESIDAGEGRLYRIIDINPSIPQNFSGTWYNNHPKIYWTANTEPDFDHYEVWKKRGAGSWSLRTTTTNTSWIDYEEFKYTLPGTKEYVYYKIKAVDGTNNKSDFTSQVGFAVNEWQQSKGTIDFPVVEIDPIPTEFKLHPVYPNPCNLSTTIKLDLPEETRFSLAIYDLNGAEIWSLNKSRVNTLRPGYHTIVWDGRNNFGVVVPTGVYLIVFNSAEYILTQKVVLMK